VGGQRAQGAASEAGRPLAPGRPGTAKAEDPIFELLFDLVQTKSVPRHRAAARSTDGSRVPGRAGRAAFVITRTTRITLSSPPYATLDATRTFPSSRPYALADGAAHPYHVGPSADLAASGPSRIGERHFVVAFHPRNRDVQAFHSSG